jgi:glycine cleavage system H protein
MNFPENLKYTQEHEWLLLDGNTAKVGITAFAQNELGDIVYVDINTQGQTIEKDAIFGSVEAVKTVSDLFLPVTAKILEVNNLIDAKPELVNSDPYGDGWMVKIEVTNIAQVGELMSASEYKALIGVK